MSITLTIHNPFGTILNKKCAGFGGSGALAVPSPATGARIATTLAVMNAERLASDEVNRLFEKSFKEDIEYKIFMERLLKEMSGEDIKHLLLDVLEKISKEDRKLSDFHLNKNIETAIIEFMINRS